jgi:hypothetical protein
VNYVKKNAIEVQMKYKVLSEILFLNLGADIVDFEQFLSPETVQ